MIVAGLGLNSLFVDYIMAFKNRPVKLNDMELQWWKDLLLKHVNKLREKGKSLELRKNSVMKSRGLSGW